MWRAASSPRLTSPIVLLLFCVISSSLQDRRLLFSHFLTSPLFLTVRAFVVEPSSARSHPPSSPPAHLSLSLSPLLPFLSQPSSIHCLSVSSHPFARFTSRSSRNFLHSHLTGNRLRCSTLVGGPTVQKILNFPFVQRRTPKGPTVLTFLCERILDLRSHRKFGTCFFHIFPKPAHTLLARACRSVLFS